MNKVHMLTRSGDYTFCGKNIYVGEVRKKNTTRKWCDITCVSCLMGMNKTINGLIKFEKRNGVGLKR